MTLKIFLHKILDTTNAFFMVSIRIHPFNNEVVDYLNF